MKNFFDWVSHSNERHAISVHAARKSQSGQALLGGLFFLLFAISASVYFIFVSNSLRELYANTLKSRFEKISEISKYANILNEISVNNQNIIVSLMTAQVAYISAIETGLTISYEQPYWQTYKNFQNVENKSALSEESLSVIQKSFEPYSLSTGRGLYVAEALASKNLELLNLLPPKIRSFFSQSSHTFVQCLALEFQKSDLSISHYVHFLVPPTYQFGVTKKNCTLQHKNNFLQKIMSKGLPVLISNDSDFIIAFDKMDEYFSSSMSSRGLTAGSRDISGKNFSYGIVYVKPELSREFMESLKFETTGTLKAIVRMSHPEFSCQNKLSLQGSFTIEEDWKNPCEISTNHFLKSFFKPNWSALVTFQEKGLRRR